ncbi:MAG TPA: hypothetical protein VNJ04_20670, partial [Gemmatimonadaceae bacterium]|nr:hypothetical protein [Gemmatimonadaceae bacterium]
MPLPTFKTKDEIPTGFESEYEEVEGEWKPKESKLESTLERLKQEKKDERDSRKKLEDELADLRRKSQAMETGEEKDKVKKLLEKFDSDLKAAKEPLEKQLAEAQGRLRTLQLDDQAKAAFIKAGGRPEKADAALKLKKESLDLAEDRIVVKNDKGEPTTATIDDFWGKSFKSEMPEFFQGTKATGGGAGGGAGLKSAGSGTSRKWDAEAVIANPLGAL